MGVKGYLFIRLRDGLTAQDCLETCRRLESLREVVYYDKLIDIDWCDILALVDAPVIVCDVAHKIEKIPGVASIQSCRVVAGPDW